MALGTESPYQSPLPAASFCEVRVLAASPRKGKRTRAAFCQQTNTDRIHTMSSVQAHTRYSLLCSASSRRDLAAWSTGQKQPSRTSARSAPALSARYGLCSFDVPAVACTCARCAGAGARTCLRSVTVCTPAFAAQSVLCRAQASIAQCRTFHSVRLAVWWRRGWHSTFELSTLTGPPTALLRC